MKTNGHEIKLAPLANGGYSVIVSTLPGCVTWGTSRKHAIAMAKETVELWLEEALDPNHD